MVDQLGTWSALVTVYQDVLHEVVRALEEQAGIDSGVYSVLAHLDRAKPSGRLALGELQQLMHPRYSQPGLSRLVQRMESAGLVERRVDAADRRAATVIVTRAGRAVFKRARTVYEAAVHEHFGDFIDNDRLRDDLHRITARRPAR